MLAVLELPAPVKVNPVTRVPFEALLVMVIAPAPPIVVVPPMLPARVIPIVPGIVRFDQVAVHGPGTLTVSPDEAELIAFCTVVWVQEAAFIVAASEISENIISPGRIKERAGTIHLN